jgi:hypothetical protein
MVKSRGVILTIFALLYVLLAISNFSKPLSHSPGIGFVFLGDRLTGTANAILGPLFGIILLAYAYGIWAMRKFALPLAYIYTAWVIVNVVMFSMKNRDTTPSAAFAIGTLLVAIGIPLATAVILTRRKAELT